MPAGRPLPPDPQFPPIASDWLTGEKSPDIIFREGKWWTTHHWNWSHAGLGRERDFQRQRRNLGIRTFLNSQTHDYK